MRLERKLIRPGWFWFQAASAVRKSEVRMTRYADFQTCDREPIDERGFHD